MKRYLVSLMLITTCGNLKFKWACCIAGVSEPMKRSPSQGILDSNLDTFLPGEDWEKSSFARGVLKLFLFVFGV